jgi:hypothetical protein
MYDYDPEEQEDVEEQEDEREVCPYCNGTDISPDPWVSLPKDEIPF